MSTNKLLILSLSLFFLVCKASKEKTNLSVRNDILGITFLDSTQAASQILQENIDGFFESLSIVEISIQMKSEEKYDSKQVAIDAYKSYLTTEVYGFTVEEQALMVEVFTEAKRILDKVNPNLWPNNIDLIKTRTNHYGPDVYYTREDAIIIPDNVFKDNRTSDGILPVMLHEIFHILSRYNNEFRNEAFALIDFYPHGKKIVLPPSMESKRLTNPDGVTIDYAVRLEDGKGNNQMAMPFLVSNQPYFSKNIPSFFAYLSFDLYPLEKLQNGYILGADKAGKTNLDPIYQADYFNHIADNTQYVIHPEEVMADNFMLSTMAYDKGDYKEFSKVGRELIDKVLDLLKSFDKE